MAGNPGQCVDASDLCLGGCLAITSNIRQFVQQKGPKTEKEHAYIQNERGPTPLKEEDTVINTVERNLRATLLETNLFTSSFTSETSSKLTDVHLTVTRSQV